MSLVSTGRSGFNLMSSGSSSGMPGSTYDWTAAYGGKPNVPDPTATASQAVSGNNANLPGIGNLASGIDASNTQNLSTALAAMIPDYANLTQSRSGDISSELSGQLPTDVIQQLQQQGAERGVSSGSPGSSNAGAAYLRALGLNSLQMQQQGMGNLAQAVTTTPLPKMFDPSSMLVSPEQQQSAAMAANMYASAPDPYAAAMAAMSAGQIPQAPQKGTNYPTINPGPQTRPGSKASGVPNIEGGSQAADPTTMGEQTTNTPWNNLFSNWQAAYGGTSTGTGSGGSYNWGGDPMGIDPTQIPGSDDSNTLTDPTQYDPYGMNVGDYSPSLLGS